MCDHCAVELRFEDDDGSNLPPLIFYCARPQLHPGRHRARQRTGEGASKWTMTWQDAKPPAGQALETPPASG